MNEPESRHARRSSFSLSRLGKRLKVLFFQDFHVRRSQVLNLLLQGLVLSTLVSAWIYHVFQGNSEYSEPEQWFLIVSFGLVLLFGGIIIDNLVLKRHAFQVIAAAATFAFILVLYVPSHHVVVIFTWIMGMLLALMVIYLFTGVLLDTDSLNRARITTFIMVVMLSFSAPIVLLVVVSAEHHWVWIISSLLLAVSVYTSRRFPRRHPVVSLKKHGSLSLREYFLVLKDTGALPHALFFLFISLILGFFLTDALEIRLGRAEIATIAIVAILSIPLVATVLDKRPRKPLVFFTLFLVAVFVIFHDYQGQLVFLNPFRVGLYVFSAILVLILAIVVSGDLTSTFSRGRITGTLIFSSVFGAILGVFLKISQVVPAGVDIDNWTTLVMFCAVFAYGATNETFEAETPRWREYLVKLYLISHAGYSLYSRKFTTTRGAHDSGSAKRGPGMETPVNEVGEMENPGHDIQEVDGNGSIDGKESEFDEDLVSGGISGIQSLISEIAQSKDKIRVLDHGDVSLIFHHGQFSTAVLFAGKDLLVLREKLANFHLLFEYLNKDLLEKEPIFVGGLRELDALVKRFFL